MKLCIRLGSGKRILSGIQAMNSLKLTSIIDGELELAQSWFRN